SVSSGWVSCGHAPTKTWSLSRWPTMPARRTTATRPSSAGWCATRTGPTSTRRCCSADRPPVCSSPRSTATRYVRAARARCGATSGGARRRIAESATGELGGTLLEERGHAFLEVLAAEERQQLQEDVVHVLLERLGLGHPHHALRRAHRERRV